MFASPPPLTLPLSENPPLTSIQPDADDQIRDTPTVPPLALDSGASPASQVEHRDRVNSNSTGDGASFADSATVHPHLH